MTFNPAFCLDNLSRICRGGQDLRNQRVWVQSDWGNQLLQLLGRMLGSWRRLLFVGLACRTESLGLRSESHKKTAQK